MRPYSLLLKVSCALAFAALAGCASYTGSTLRPGVSTEADVRAAMGQPYAVHPAPPGAGYAQSLEYPHGPGGRQTYMARLDASGKLVSVDQVLQERTLTRIRVGVDNMQSISALLGRPGQYTGPNRMYGGPTWDYFANDMQRHIIISVSFDRNGVVAAAGSMTDPMDFVPAGSM
jgi:hypothetical protein